MNEAERQMVDLYLDGEMTQTEAVDFLQRLEGAPEAVAYFAERALFASDLRRACKRRALQAIAVVSTAETPELRAGTSSRNVRTFKPPYLAVAASVLLGMFFASVGWATALPWLSQVRQSTTPVFREGFEGQIEETEPRIPRISGYWGGDEAEVVTSAQGVKPREGQKMLRFRSASHEGEDSPRSQWGDIYRMVNVSGIAGAGRTVARVSASFAQEVSGVREGFSCSVEAIALDEDLSTWSGRVDLNRLRQCSSAAAHRKESLQPTADWKDVSVEIPITTKTHYVMLHLAVVQEQPSLESGIVQFKGHFADDVRVEVIHRPTRSNLGMQ